jgi:5'-3' exonuclease
MVPLTPTIYSVMGIDGFGTFLRRKVPGAFLRRTMKSYTGSRMAFDMHQWLYQAFFRNAGDAKNALRDVGYFIRSLQALSVTATFVFDGSTTGLKPRAHRERTAASVAAQTAVKAMEQDQLTTEFRTMEDFFVASEALTRKKAQASKPSWALFEDAKSLLRTFGTVVSADDDAERLIAAMAARGEVDHAVSKDYDTLVFGAPEVVIDFPLVFREPVGTEEEQVVSCVRLDAVLAGLGFSCLGQLQDMAILAGCDYTEKIPGVGPGTAHKLILAHKTIEMVLASASLKRTVPPSFDAAFARARFRGEDPHAASRDAKEEAVAREAKDTVVDVDASAAVDASEARDMDASAAVDASAMDASEARDMDASAVVDASAIDASVMDTSEARDMDASAAVDASALNASTTDASAVDASAVDALDTDTSTADHTCVHMSLGKK